MNMSFMSYAYKMKMLIFTMYYNRPMKHFLFIFAMIIQAIPGFCGASNFEANAVRMETRILQLGQYGWSNTGSQRVAFSEHDAAARKFFMGLMKNAGLEVHIDFAGNIIGKREGKNDELPPIVFGSHLDTVPNGGMYDGIVGSVAALEVIEILNHHDVVTNHPLELIVFSDEEGGLTGSRALIGKLGPEALKVRSHSGKTIAEGIRFLGGDPARLGEMQRKPGDIAVFLELHIEQGRVLDRDGLNIGIVEGIVGIEWWDVIIEGFANHAGTTPMKGRQDAVLAGSKFALAVNEIAKSYQGNQVATVGRFRAEPGAPNVIAGKVDLSLEIRDLSDKKIWQIYRDIEKRAKLIASETGTKITFEYVDVVAKPAVSDAEVTTLINNAVVKLGYSYKYMPSGAGHDAQDMSQISLMGMIFVPSRNGISHSPEEFTRSEDMARGANVLIETILGFDRSNDSDKGNE